MKFISNVLSKIGMLNVMTCFGVYAFECELNTENARQIHL